LKKQGKKIGILDLTRGELGTRGTPETRESEAKAAGEIIGVDFRENLGLPDGSIEITPATKAAVIEVIRHVRPQILLFPHWLERHPDHEHAHRLCREAWFSSGLEKLETARGGKKQEPFRPRAFYHYMQTFEFEPSFVVDISEQFEQRMESVKAFKSQFYDPSSKERETFLSTPDFLDFLRARYEYYGDRIGRKYGEPFYSVNMVGISDLFSLTA
jgi:bacillithiol biosynthesis deacetylase BshB1